MFKLLCFLVRKPGLSPAEFRAHYDTVHVPLARQTFPQIVEHRRNYPEEGGLFFPPGLVPTWDAISEIWFADRSGFDAMMALLADPVASAAVREDEQRFLDPERCGMMIVEESIGLGQRA